MQIKNKLSLYFTVVTALLSLIVLAAINMLFAKHTEDDFFTSLKERAVVTAEVYLEADEVSDSSLQYFKKEYLNTLPDEVIKMYDSTGHPAFIKDRHPDWPTSIIQQVLKDRYVEFTRNDQKIIGIRYDDNQGTFVIIASAVDKAGNERNNNLLKVTLFLYVLQLIIIFILSRWFASKMLQPVQEINKQVQVINATDLHLRLKEGNGKDEITGLAKNFNDLLQRLETSFDIQKTFVANASHELRTPLTNIIGEIEVAIALPREREEYKQVLDSVNIEAEKLNHVIDGLLQLSSAEKIIALQTVEQVRIDDLLWEIQSSFLKNNPPSCLNIHIISLPLVENKLCVTANKHLLTIALTNVIRNGFKFSYNKPVDCTLEYTNKGLELTIKDEGIGIAEEDLNMIFKPFFRGTQTAEFNGQGIGLFLTKKIVDLYNGAISYKPAVDGGTIVNIIFPSK